MIESSEMRYRLKMLSVDLPISFDDDDPISHISDTGWRKITKMFEAGQLNDLRISGCGCKRSTLEFLLQSTAAKNLSSLDISHNRLYANAYKEFQSSPAKFRSIRIAGNNDANTTLTPLLQAPCTESLLELDISHSNSKEIKFAVIAKSKYWSQAERFCASSCELDSEQFQYLTQHNSPNLRHLDLGGNYLRTEGISYLCEAPWADSLTYLSLWNNYLDDESCEVLAKSGRFKQLRTLQLSGNNPSQRESSGEQITDSGIIGLCISSALANLRMLALGHNLIGDASVEAIFNAPFTLSALHLNRTNVTKQAILTIARSPKLARLNTLDLSGNHQLRKQDLRPLAESPYLSPLCELDLTGITLSLELREAFHDRLGRRRFTYSG